MAAVTITNPGGESGDLAGWTTVSGTWASSTGAVGITPRTGLRFLYGTAGGGILQQDCAVDSGDEADIDAGRAELTVSVWVATAAAGNDRGVFQIMFLDADDNLIGEHPTDGNWEIESQSISPGTTWAEINETYRVSSGTRKVRIELVPINTSGGVDVGFDDVAMTIAQAANRAEGDFPLALAMRNTGFDFTSTQGNNVRPLSWIDVTAFTGRFRARSDFNTPISSPFHASGAGGSSVEGEQLIDLHAEQLASWIADGRLTLRFKSYVSTISDDFGRIGLIFYDEDMTVLSTELDERFQTAGDMNDDVWSEAVFFCPVPTNARFVGAICHGDNTGGSNTAFCFDDVELQAHVLGNFGAVGQFHTSFNATTVTINANEKHGAVHTIGGSDLEVHRLGSSPMPRSLPT